MKGLIIREPYIDNILSGLKSWEMRSRKTNVRGRIALIKSGTGKIYGEADLVEVLDPLETEAEIHMSWQFHRVPREKRDVLKKWRYPWRLENAVKYDEPIPYDHPQGAVTWVNLPNPELAHPKDCTERLDAGWRCPACDEPIDDHTYQEMQRCKSMMEM